MMHTPGPESTLCYFKAPALTEQHMIQRHAHIVEINLRKTERGIVVSERGQWSNQSNSGRVPGNQYLRLLFVPIRVVGV